jgi:hypothetical protein
MSSFAILPLLAAHLAAMDDSPGPATAAEPSLETWLQNLDAERAWIFAPAPDRTDPWYAFSAEELVRDTPAPPPPVQPDITARLLQAQRDLAVALADHRWSDALGIADAAQTLAAEQGNQSPIQTHSLALIAALRAQAEAGRAYDDAHARFTAVGIKVQGIMWSDDGAPLAMIDGENRALAIGDRVQDWAIAAIDRDRVVFRAHGPSHYEFTCFLGKSTD